jgi:uncharacterized protein YndB with AHSA1/START domain
MHFTNTLIIDRPVTETFAFISDFENMPKWNYFVEETTSQSPPSRGVGTIYRQRRRTDEQHFVVTDFEPDQLVAVRTLRPARDLQMRFTFAPYGGGTRLTDNWTLDTVLPRWLERIGASTVSSAVQDNLAKLKELLETGQVRLQDGRVETVSSQGRIKS